MSAPDVGGGRGWSWPIDALAHRVAPMVVLIVGLILLGALLGPGVHDALALLASVLGLVWVAAQAVHSRRDHLCERCMAAMPSNPGAAVERGLRWLRLHHWLTDSVAGLVAYAALLVLAWLPTWLGLRWLDWLWFLPIAGFTWLAMHHRRVRPWCPFCRGWDDHGSREPTPDPAGTKTRRT